MKSELDREVDRLLRAHARQNGERRATEHNAIESVVGTTEPSPHLDPDAISLYAEKALPPSALAGYTQHLVECDECRARLAMYARMEASEAELHPTVKAVASDEAIPAAASRVANTADEMSHTGWWARFTEIFFSPRNLAFALPALALLLIGITVLVIIAPQRRETEPFIADTTQPATVTSGNMNMAMNTNMSSSTSTEAMQEQATSSAPSASIVAEKMEEKNTATTRRQGEEAGVVFNQPTAQPSAIPTLPTANDFAGAGANAGNLLKIETPPSVSSANLPPNNRAANAPAANAPAAPPPPQQQMAENRKRDGQSVSVTADETITTESLRRTASAHANTSDASSATRREARSSSGMIGAQQARRRAENLNRSDGGAIARAKEANAGTASRVVGKRRFTRRNSVWVDESYKEGTVTTNIRRGSEQFRALITDESDLRQISETLPGEVIIVKRNRAYRIQ